MGGLFADRVVLDEPQVQQAHRPSDDVDNVMTERTQKTNDRPKDQPAKGSMVHLRFRRLGLGGHSSLTLALGPLINFGLRSLSSLQSRSTSAGSAARCVRGMNISLYL